MIKLNRLWPIAVAMLTAFALTIASDRPFNSDSQIGIRHLESRALASEAAGAIAKAQTKQSQASPKPTPEASPKPTPEASPTASPTPSASPVPVAPATTPTVTPEVKEQIPLTVSKTPYTDPANRYQVGVLAAYTPAENLAEAGVEDRLEEYKVTNVGGVNLIESPDGNLAYAVLVQPLATPRTLSAEELAEIALDKFDSAEGFRPGEFGAIAEGGILIPWTGTFNNTVPMRGGILARQSDRSVYLLLVSATEAAESKVDAAIDLLSETLQPM